MAKDVVHGGAFFSAIGVDLQTLSQKDKVISADVLDAWYDPSPKVLAAIQQHLPWLIKTSPPTHAEGLVKVIAEQRGFPAECILTGSGTSSLMYSAIPRLLTHGSRALLLDPTYGEYAHVAQVSGAASVDRFPLPTADFRVSLPDLIEQAQRTDLLLMVNPNSPTGLALDRAEMESMLSELPPTTKVWVDETYIDFLPGRQSVEPLVCRFPNLVVAKSMSKFYALSGLRIGYLAAHPDFIRELEPETPPWSVGLLAQLAGIEALLDVPYYQQRVADTHTLRTHFQESLRAIGQLRVLESQTNFFIAEVSRSAEHLCAQLATQGIFIRNCDSLSPRFHDNIIRIAVKSEQENARVANAISEALG